MAEKKEIIGGYKLRGQIANTGQSSQDFEVIEPSSFRHFAMKILLPEHVKKADKRKELFHEASVGIKMRHENVINILKVSRDQQNPHFVMEFFPSGSLRTRLISKDPKDKEFVKQNARKIFRQVATGLAYMNANGFVHCDVKPDNILVNAIGQAKIIDFAISKQIPKGLARLFRKKGKPQGTPSYMSPEQIRAQIPDPRWDIYSYGCTLYELTTGRSPFRGNTQNELLGKHLVEKPASPVSYNPDLTDEFGNFVVKLLAKKKENRPSNFHEVLIELKKTRIFKSFDDREEAHELA